VLCGSARAIRGPVREQERCARAFALLAFEGDLGLHGLGHATGAGEAQAAAAPGGAFAEERVEGVAEGFVAHSLALVLDGDGEGFVGAAARGDGHGAVGGGLHGVGQELEHDAGEEIGVDVDGAGAVELDSDLRRGLDAGLGLRGRGFEGFFEVEGLGVVGWELGEEVEAGDEAAKVGPGVGDGLGGGLVLGRGEA